MGNIVGITCFPITGITLDNNNNSVSCTSLRRICSARQSFRSLQKEWEKLISERDDMLTYIDHEERENRRQRTQTSVVWLSQVDSIQPDFDQLETDYSQQSANKCSTNLFKTRYTFGKNVARVRKDVDSATKSKPVEVTQQVAIMPPDEIPVDQSFGMHSMLDDVWSYMDDDEFRIIGLYGMGGVGKTTLMKELHNKTRTTQSFDVVFWIVVSSTPSLSKVQDDIGSVLGLQGDEWKEKSQEDKAKVILRILKLKKYVLFIDDIWERIDLIKLGVPVPNQTNKSKIVLTTRSREVCGQMEVDKTIQVKCLKEDAAWDLFRKKAGEKTIDDDPEIEKIAKLVAKECAALPLALIVIGRAMACKTTPRAWNTALQKLKKYTSFEIQGMEEHVLRLLKFSYDSLSNASMKSCFLYCSLYPEDYLINKDDIIDKWICEGFLDTVVDLDEARNEGYDYIDTLVNASLLEQTTYDGCVKMHDIIREMANWIGCECGEIKKKFYVRAGVGLTETPNVMEFEASERMSLMENEIDKLTGKPNCPNMLTLFLNENIRLNHIENEFFRSMENLGVLDLSGNGSLKKIPKEVFNLVTLQYLNIRISRVPINLCKLINLKWLCVQNHYAFIPLPEGVLSCLKKLQVLYIKYVCLPETFVVEMESLELLKDLRITIMNDVHLSALLSSHKLASIITSLCAWQITSRNLDLLVTQKMVKLESLDIVRCEELEYVMSSSRELNNDVMSSLKRLYIIKCPKVKDITTVFTFAPNLETISIRDCSGMKELCGAGKCRPTPFPKLKRLLLYTLPELERIYPNALPLLFPCLKQMYILECPKLRKLPLSGNSGCGVTIEGEEEWWNGLEWEDEATRNAVQFIKC